MTVLNPSLVSPLPPTTLSQASGHRWTEGRGSLDPNYGGELGLGRGRPVLGHYFFLLRPARQLRWTEDHNEQT